MIKDFYPTKVSTHFIAYDFISEGRNGKILKGIRYNLTEFSNIWNLGFGDLDPLTGEINDLSVSNNGDSEKVLATVARTCIEFTDHFPEAMIFAVGSTKVRTRLYQMGINSHLDEILELFIIKGLLNGQWEAFRINKNYDALLIKRRKL